MKNETSIRRTVVLVVALALAGSVGLAHDMFLVVPDHHLAPHTTTTVAIYNGTDQTVDVDAGGSRGDTKVIVKGTVETIEPEISRTDLWITATDVALDAEREAYRRKRKKAILTQMHGYSVCPRQLTLRRRPHRIRLVGTPRLSNRRHMIDIYI